MQKVFCNHIEIKEGQKKEDLRKQEKEKTFLKSNKYSFLK
jgi:hypothetical protein